MLDGFGFQDTHKCLNSFLWGPDGWLYGNQGVFNYARIGQRVSETPKGILASLGRICKGFVVYD